MTASRKKPLLASGNEAEWAEINREEDEQRRSIARGLTPSQRIARGQKLSQQAVRLLAASIRAGNVPRRTLGSPAEVSDAHHMRADLEELEALHGELPPDRPDPGLDT